METIDYKAFFKNDRYAALTGIKLTEIKPGYATAELTIEDKHLNAGDVIQGGVLFTLADFVMAAAANAHGRLAFSIQSDIRFLQSAGVGETIYAIAHEVLFHKTICHYHVEITTGNDIKLAVFDGICYRKDNISPIT